MGVSIFLSYPKPHQEVQQRFVGRLEKYLIARGLSPRTLGVSDYDMDAPLAGIRRLMIEACGLLAIAFRRTLVNSAVVRSGPDIAGARESMSTDFWLTSPYTHIEPAMAFQLGLPILIWKEKGVLAEGVLERGVTGLYLPEFDANTDHDFLERPEWTHILNQWEGRVRRVYDRRGEPWPSESR